MTWPWMLGALLGGAVLALTLTGVVLWVRRRRRVARAFGDADLLARLLGADLRDIPWRRVALVAVSAAALAVALVDPRWGVGDDGSAASGGPVVLVIDVSSSMLVSDVEPSRLAWAQVTASELVQALGDVPVGIVVFAGRAYALSPPTRDAGAVGLFLETLDPQMITQTGSALAGAIRQGVGLLVAGEAEGGTMVLISDGNTADDPADLDAAVRLARRAGVPVLAVGVGSPRGGPVPDLDPVSGEMLGYKRESDGTVVESHLAEGILQAIAAGTGGRYLPAERAPVQRLASLVRSGSGRGGGVSMEGPPRFAWFAALALVALAVEGLVGRGREP